MNDEQRYQAAYAFWRWEMWLAGYGSYNTIERLVQEKKLIPFKPEKEQPFQPKKGSAK